MRMGQATRFGAGSYALSAVDAQIGIVVKLFIAFGVVGKPYSSRRADHFALGTKDTELLFVNDKSSVTWWCWRRFKRIL